MTENNRNNHDSWRDRSKQGGVLRILRRNVILKACLSVVTVVLTIVLIFSLTVAWYTNVVQTGGLALKAEEWNFDGEIELLMESSIQATPGDEGFIPVRITNDGEHIVAASATVVKSQMDEEMRKRLYFYVDTSMERNRETLERVFLSEKSSYTYTIFPHSTLELSTSVKNGPLIKWMWVYDVLGYYVWGQQIGSTVEPQDYIRPVEYDYDPVTTTFGADGKLATVDGSKTAATFVRELTATDGYPGVLDMDTEDTAPVGGYYPISVNEDGYGVWLYLCSREEIQANMQYDTTVGADPNQVYTATVTITGQNSREDSIPVSNAQELQQALNDPTVGIVQLANDVQLTDTLNLTKGSAVIDLNGKTLSVASDVEKIVDLTSGARLALQNGNVVGAGKTDAHAAVTMSGAHLTVNDVKVTNVGTGLRVEDYNATSGYTSTVTLNNCEITADQQAVWVYGNLEDTKLRTKIVIENCPLIQGENYAGILCSGNYGGTDIVVSNTKVTGYYAAIYHPQRNSTLLIENQTELRGETGLVVKGGKVTVTNSTVIGQSDTPDSPAYQMSGWAETGDGIYLEANYAANNRDWDASVTVRKSTVISNHAHAVRKFEEEAANATLTVESGSFYSFAADDSAVPDDFDAAVYMEPYLASGSKATVDANKNKICTVTAEAVTP